VADRELLEAMAEGDAQAFADLYRGYYLRLWRYAVARLGDRDEAATVVQETLLAVWRRPRSHTGEGSVAGWIFGIARHKIGDALRARRRRPPPVADDGPARPGTVVPDPAPVVVQRADLQEALGRLSPEQREVVFLTFYAGLSYGEIAAMTGIPPGTVKSRMYHARRYLRQSLAGGEDDEAQAARG